MLAVVGTLGSSPACKCRVAASAIVSPAVWAGRLALRRATNTQSSRKRRGTHDLFGVVPGVITPGYFHSCRKQRGTHKSTQGLPELYWANLIRAGNGQHKPQAPSIRLRRTQDERGTPPTAIVQTALCNFKFPIGERPWLVRRLSSISASREAACCSAKLDVARPAWR